MSKCPSCGAEVIWRRIGKKPACFNPDGVTVHWDTCTRLRWEQTKATGQPFEAKVGNATVKGYKNSVHGTRLEEITMPAIRGERYREPTGLCRCDLPPWDLCPSCPDRFNKVAA